MGGEHRQGQRWASGGMIRVSTRALESIASHSLQRHYTTEEKKDFSPLQGLTLHLWFSFASLYGALWHFIAYDMTNPIVFVLWLQTAQKSFIIWRFPCFYNTATGTLCLRY